MPLFFKVNQSTGEIIASHNGPSDSCIPPQTGFGTVQVTIDMVDLYMATPTDKKAVWSDSTVIYQDISPPDLATIQTSICATLLNNVNQFTEYYPDGGIRYDINFKFAALIFVVQAGIGTAPAPSLLSWMQAVQTYYFTVKAQVMACTTVAQAQAIDISVAGFEAKYGINGTILADPNVGTAQLMVAP